MGESFFFHLSVLLQSDGAIIVRVVHVEQDWEETEEFSGLVALTNRLQEVVITWMYVTIQR